LAVAAHDTFVKPSRFTRAGTEGRKKSVHKRLRDLMEADPSVRTLLVEVVAQQCVREVDDNMRLTGKNKQPSAFHHSQGVLVPAGVGTLFSRMEEDLRLLNPSFATILEHQMDVRGEGGKAKDRLRATEGLKPVRDAKRNRAMAVAAGITYYTSWCRMSALQDALAAALKGGNLDGNGLQFTHALGLTIATGISTEHVDREVERQGTDSLGNRRGMETAMGQILRARRVKVKAAARRIQRCWARGLAARRKSLEAPKPKRQAERSLSAQPVPKAAKCAQVSDCVCVGVRVVYADVGVYGWGFGRTLRPNCVFLSRRRHH
jgi:hypothetical protein